MKIKLDWKSRFFTLALSLLLPLATASCQSVSPAPSTNFPSKTLSLLPAATETPGNTHTAQGTPGTAGIGKVGERVVSAGVAITVTSISKTTRVGFLSASLGNIYLDIDVCIENVDLENNLPYNPYYFKVKDGSGRVSTAALTSLGIILKTGELPPGEQVRGHLAFEVKDDSAQPVLSFEPNVYLPNYQPIQIDLSQKDPHPFVAPTIQPPTSTEQVGLRHLSGDVALTISNVSRQEEISVYNPDEGNIFLDLDVLLQNTGKGNSISYSPLDFRLKDSEGYEYTSALISLKPALVSGDLAAGQSAKGHLAFEVRQEASGFVLVYQPLSFLTAAEKITIPLGR
jgi:hypothetical protein